MESFRRVYGALKDSTKVGLARINSDFKDLDIAIIKATNHEERCPRERHVRKILVSVSVSRPRADVAYCIYALSRRLAKTRNWIVAIKTLIVFHRALREADPSFREELLRYSERRNLFHVSKFKDDSSIIAWDCSAWIRTYGLFLEERLECSRTLNYDIESDKILKGDELLRKLPSLQQLLHRIVDCQPQGAASHNFLVQYAMTLVLNDSFTTYCTISDGITKLIAKFFEMAKNDAIQVLDIYRRAAHHTELLADCYRFCKTLALARTSQFPILRQLPPSFLANMEEYVMEAPPLRSDSSNKQLEYRVTEVVPQKSKGMGREEITQQAKGFENNLKKVDSKEKPQFINLEKGTPTLISAKEPTDLIDLDRVNPEATAVDQSNALALAILQSDNYPQSTNDTLLDTGKYLDSGWELALVTAPSKMNSTQATDSKMAGGFDKLLLDSLYEDNVARRQIQLHRAGYSSWHGYGTTTQNTLSRYNPFATSNDVEPPSNLQLSMMPQLDQHMFFDQQESSTMMLPWNPYLVPQMRNPNAFGGPFMVSSGMGNHALL